LICGTLLVSVPLTVCLTRPYPLPRHKTRRKQAHVRTWWLFSWTR
jgi:hypothetical protein